MAAPWTFLFCPCKYMYSHVTSTIPLPGLRTIRLFCAALSLMQKTTMKFGMCFKSTWWTDMFDIIGDSFSTPPRRLVPTRLPQCWTRATIGRMMHNTWIAHWTLVYRTTEGATCAAQSRRRSHTSCPMSARRYIHWTGTTTYIPPVGSSISMRFFIWLRHDRLYALAWRHLIFIPSLRERICRHVMIFTDILPLLTVRKSGWDHG